MTVAVDPAHDRKFWTAPVRQLRRRWLSSSLALQFLAAGSVVSLIAILLVGLLVTSLLERAVTRNAAVTTALYVDSVIAPLLPDLQRNAVLDDPIKRALDETLGKGALGDRLVAMRIWSTNGTILYATNNAIVGQRFTLSDELRRAVAGDLNARYHPDGSWHQPEPPAAGPLLAIYNPLLQPWSGQVVAVMEFYEVADELRDALTGARLRSWLAVAATTASFFLLLGVIVLRGSRTIDEQGRKLSAQVTELTRLLDANRALQKRVVGANQRASAVNESHLRRLGADLHDGPAQLIALASLRLDSEALLSERVPLQARTQEVERIRDTLADALREVRSICRGLVLPHIEGADVAGVVSRAIDDYEQRTRATVERRIEPIDRDISLSQRICAYRFVQEALNNGYRHCPGAAQAVEVKAVRNALRVTVSDCGPGFDPASIKPGSIGIEGLRDRIESLGGSFNLRSSAAGTTLIMSLPIDEDP